jgi:hypothetical protein
MSEKNMSEKHILEEHLFKPVSDFLIKNGYQVRSELKFCDIIAIKGDELIIVELKKHLSVELLIQGVKRQKVSDATYIAVPKPKKLTGTSKWKDICHLIRRLELGLLLVSFKGDNAMVEIAVEPVSFDRVRSSKNSKNKRARIVQEFKGRNMDLNIGGSRGRKLVTAYREQALYIVCCMDMLGQLSTKQLKRFGSDPKKTSPILNKNFYGWFNRVKIGLYELSDTGKASVLLYDELISIFRLNIEEIVKRETEEKEIIN